MILLTILILLLSFIYPAKIDAAGWCCGGDPTIYCGEWEGMDCVGGTNSPDWNCYPERYVGAEACYGCKDGGWLSCFCTGLVDGTNCLCGRYGSGTSCNLSNPHPSDPNCFRTCQNGSSADAGSQTESNCSCTYTSEPSPSPSPTSCNCAGDETHWCAGDPINCADCGGYSCNDVDACCAEGNTHCCCCPSGGTCFPQGTEITMSDGSKKDIKDVKVGEMVLSYDTDKGEYTKKEVLFNDSRHTVNSHAKACMQLGDEPSLYTINNGLIEFTPEHPFWVREKVEEKQNPILNFLKIIF